MYNTSYIICNESIVKGLCMIIRSFYNIQWKIKYYNYYLVNNL